MLRGVRIAALVLLWTIPGGILYTALSRHWTPVWLRWGVPSMAPSFFDLRSITAGIETQKHGGDPLRANPYDRILRPVNYPRVWLYGFSMLGINDKSLPVVGVMFCGLYLLCISNLILRSKNAAESVVLLLAGLSPMALLAIERGNNDQLVFALLFLGCVATRESLKLGSYSLAALLKIFPLVALAAHAVLKPARNRLAPILLILAILATFVFQWRDLDAIRRGTPIDPWLSYGVFSLKAQAFPIGGSRTTVVLCCWLIMFLVAGNAWMRAPQPGRAIADSKAGEMFFVFGSIYVLSFATAANFDYRLIFLTPTLPFSFEWIRNAQRKLFGLAYAGLVLAAQYALLLPLRYTAVVVDASTLVLTMLVVTVLTEQAKQLLFSSGTAWAGEARDFSSTALE